MKIHGNYYKNTRDGKKKEDFELDIASNTLNLTELRREATKILENEDKEFRGVRELFADEIELPKKQIQVDGVEEQEIRQLARERGIKYAGQKKIERLLEELEQLETK